MSAATACAPCQPVSIALGSGPSAEELVCRAAGWDGLVCLHGAWAEGTPLLASHPLRVVADGPDAIDALDAQPAVEDPPGGFVGGGWFGVLAYDGPSYLAFHDHVVRRVEGEWRFEALWSDERGAALDARLEAWRAALAATHVRPTSWSIGDFDAPPRADHLAAVERAVELIRAGELYQVNVCTRLVADFAGSPAGLFADLAAALGPVRGAYVPTTDGALASMSPELFLRRRGRAVRTSPIKGTLPRDVAGNDRRLRGSAKDAAENVMIVDLMRNDLGRVCEPGTVRAVGLLDVEAHPGVWHLVSTVEGRLRAGIGDADLLRAAFPPGSVTGAPKVRAQQAIIELEPVARRAYTGALGFASPCWGAEWSVVIRTLEIAAGRVEIGVGGGITADSVPMLEWRECLHKAAPLVAAARSGLTPATLTPVVAPARDQYDGGLLETVLAVDGAPLRLEDHLARLDRSCRELFGAGLPADLAERARAAVAGSVGRAVLRVVVRPGVAVDVSAAPIGLPPEGSDACLAERDGTALWRHKWADRAALVAAEQAVAPRVPLFVATVGTVLETSRGNVFLVDPDGTLVTAPLRDDLLPGVTRRAVLDQARDDGRTTALREFDVSELRARPAFWTSSLSGAVPIHSVDGLALPRADALIARIAARLLGGGKPDR